MLQPGYFPGNLLFSLLFFAALAFFARSVYKLYQSIRLGAPEARFDRIPERLRGVLTYVFGQKRVRREPSGWGHFVIFWGFIIITIGSLETFGVGFYHGFAYWKLIGRPLTALLYLLQDLLCLGVIVALIIALYRRFVLRPERLRFRDQRAADRDAATIIGLILALIVLLFGARAVECRLALVDGSRYFPPAAFISCGLATLFSSSAAETLHRWYAFFWWAHTLIILAFLVYIPFSKHLHLLAAIPNIFFRRLTPPGELAKMDLEDEEAETFGVGKIQDFTWKQLLDLYACTECGRCSDNCPAHLTGKPLSPKETIHSLREYLRENSSHLLKKTANPEGTDSEADSPPEMIGTACVPDEIWSCTTCGNCVEHCPVFIEHVDKFVDMRRYLVLMESSFPAEVQTVFRNWETNSNPWGIGFAHRGDWAKDLPVQTLAENSAVDYLLYVGCAGSFDDRSKKISAAVVQLLNHAGVSFGILGPEEKCCGETARRIGNEYLFQMMAADLLETIQGYGIKKIITTCPHGYNCLRNEYHQFGADWQVVHHSEFLAQLLADGALKVTAGMDKKVVFHDSCYLGRYNNIYAQPRALLQAIPGVHLLEMARCRDKSFCCGAGGGRMWMEETLGQEKINQARTRQALESDPQMIAVCCPFCTTMFEDGLKEQQLEDHIKVYDVAEILLQVVLPEKTG